MKWASALSESADARAAAREGAETLRAQLSGADPDLVGVFASGRTARGFEEACHELSETWPEARQLGCTAHGVIAAGREIEAADGLALAAGQLPGVEISAFAFAPGELPDGPDPWRSLSPGGDPSGVVLLADPLTCDAETLLATAQAAYPGAVQIGGLASGGGAPGDHRLRAGQRSLSGGAAGLLLAGDLEIDSIVAQGCRPIGSPMFVTRASGNALLELDGRPPAEVLQELFARASQRDRALFTHSLFIGLEMREGQSEYRAGDFLVRNIAGLEPESGALGVGGPLRVHQVAQFHLRDRDTSAEDLERQLERHAREGLGSSGGLMFSCVGRGAGLYGAPDHDSRVLARHLGPLPVAGFFGNGEIGPVGSRSFLHAYTSAFALFRAPAP